MNVYMVVNQSVNNKGFLSTDSPTKKGKSYQGKLKTVLLPHKIDFLISFG